MPKPQEWVDIPGNPGVANADVVRQMVYPAIAGGRKLLVGVCCNTFHDEPTFRPFLQRLREPWPHGCVCGWVGAVSGENEIENENEDVKAPPLF